MQKLTLYCLLLIMFGCKTKTATLDENDEKPIFFSILMGTRESHNRELRQIKKDHLDKIKNYRDLNKLKRTGYLTELPSVMFDTEQVRKDFRYLTPSARYFTQTMSDSLYKNFGIQFKISSAVRTREYQDSLRGKNRNASSNSTHMYGATFDITKKGHTEKELNRIREYLSAKEESGICEATEEFNQGCFHILVFKK